MNSLFQIMRHLGPARLAVMALVAVGLIGFFTFMTSRLSNSEMALLYGDLAVEDVGAITARLDGQQIPYDVRGGGTQVYVPVDAVGRLRVAMASEGLPNGGSVGYELFDKSEALGTTSFVQRINHVRALEGELSRTIASIQQVQSARVHLVLPKREVFSRERQEPTASVVLKIRGPGLQSGQVLAIQHIVATAVPGLQPERISIVDSTGRLLARGGDETQEGMTAVSAEEARQRYEARSARAVEKLLENAVGIGAVRAEVSAEIDFDRVTTTNEEFDPDGQVVRSTQTVEQEDASTEAQTDKSVSITNNLPNAGADEGEADAKSRANSNRVEETVNYEVSRTVTTQVRETGQVKRLTVAVLIDGTYDAEGNYTPRTPEEMAQFASLVKTSIGFDESRGDKVEIVNQRFAVPDFIDDPAEDPGLMGLSKSDLFRIAEMLVLGIVSVLVLLLVVRPLVGRVFEAAAAGAAADAAAQGLLAAGDSQARLALPPGGDEMQQIEAQARRAQQGDQEDEMEINLAQVDGKVKKSSLSQIGQIVEKHPEETLAIMRSWMYQDA